MFDKDKLPEITISVHWDKNVNKEDLITVKGSEEMAKLCYEIFNKDTFNWTEEVLLILLNQANKVLSYKKISSGGISGTILDPRVVFMYAIQGLAVNIIVAHNHPSGNLEPSKQDKYITDKLKEAGKVLDIRVLDHIIVAGEGQYYSFADEGIL